MTGTCYFIFVKHVNVITDTMFLFHCEKIVIQICCPLIQTHARAHTHTYTHTHMHTHAYTHKCFHKCGLKIEYFFGKMFTNQGMSIFKGAKYPIT